MLKDIKASTEAFTPLQIIAAAQATKSVASALAQAKSANVDNLIAATRDTRVEPIALIDSTIINEPYISEILAVNTKMFASYYLRAVEMSNKIGGIEISQRLGKFNPNRSVINAVISTASFEEPNSYPSLGTTYKVATEAREKVAGGKSESNDIAGSIKQMDNLALGMTINVTFTHESEVKKMPINIRMIPVSSAPQLIVNTFQVGANTNSAKERWHRFKAGELSLIGDLILCNDLIDSHRRAEIKDTSGYYTETMRRRRNNTISGIISGSPSIASSSNLLIVSKRTATQIEGLLEGSLDDVSVRERAFEHTSVMLLVVVDPDWERIRIYSRSIEIPTDLKFRDFRDVNSKNGADIEDILRMYQDASKPNARTGVVL